MIMEELLKIMKKRIKKIVSVVLCGICCITLLGGCAAEDRTAENAGAGKDTEASVQNSAGNSSGSDSIGEFDMKDITGEDYTEEIFADGSGLDIFSSVSDKIVDKEYFGKYKEKGPLGRGGAA